MGKIPGSHRKLSFSFNLDLKTWLMGKLTKTKHLINWASNETELWLPNMDINTD